jgi:Xaa-Pro aminopeptidase
MIVSNLDEIAWVLNLRGNDIDYNPLFYSFLILHKEDPSREGLNGTLYINQKKVSESVRHYLEDELKCEIKEYTDFYTDVKESLTGNVSVDLSKANSRISRELSLNKKIDILNEDSVCEKFKGVKNNREIKGFIECHSRDAAALC